MRLIGVKAPVPNFRYDLVYLVAGLTADHRPEVKALAAPIAQLITELRDEREIFELAEDNAIIKAAQRGRHDITLDTLLIAMSGVARAIDKDLYKTLFGKKNPSTTARMALEEEVVEADRILAEIAEEPTDHPIRKEYEPAITAALDAVRTSMKSAQDADTALALARSRLERFKLKVDKARLETHGKLVVLLKDRKEADAFFRSTSSAPGSNEKEPTPEPATT